MRGALKASSFEKWEPENLSCVMEIDSCSLSGECAVILDEPLRMPVLTFGVELGKAHSRLSASLTPGPVVR